MEREQISTEVQRLHGEGYSIRNIADKTGISKSSVGRIVKGIQENALGTGVGTCPDPLVGTAGMPPGTASTTVPTGSWEKAGIQNNSIDHEKEVISSLQKGEEEDSALNKGLWLMLIKQGLGSRYRNFLYSTEEFLGNNLGSEELALSLVKSRLSRVGELINHAFGVCIECHVQYDSLHMAYVLDQLYFFLSQQPELEKIGYGLKIKECASMQLLLRGAAKLDVFYSRPRLHEIPHHRRIGYL